MTTREQVLDTIDRVYRSGLTTTSGGNISAIDRDGHIFITPSGIDKGTLCTQDISEVLPDGTRRGRFAPSMELPFHSNIYRLRPDIRGIVHAHAPAVVAYATAHAVPDSAVVGAYAAVIGPVTGSEYELPGSLKLGEIVKGGFEKGFDAVMMDNHGATVGGRTLAKAYVRYETLDYLCQTLIDAQILGGVAPYRAVSRASEQAPVFSDSRTAEERSAAEEVVTFLHRSYANKLVGAGFGTVAVRVKDGFVFNADCDDRARLTTADIVVCRAGKLSADKSTAYLRELTELFGKMPEANAVIISMPPAIMGFAVAHVSFDSALIPESYIMLRAVTRAADFAAALSALSVSAPVAVVDNDCAVTVGKNLTKAFDRMEVLEYSARSVVMARSIADIVPISARRIGEIDDTFNGW